MEKHKKKKEEGVLDIMKESGKNLIKGITGGMGLRSNKVGKTKKK